MTVFLSHTPSSSFAKNPKVVVVGGGIAGLTTAYRLKSAGKNVDLYEARNRVGGRIFTASVDGRLAELGGQNISDGGQAVNLNRLIAEFELPCISSRVYLKHSYFDGLDLTPIHKILKNKTFDPDNLKITLDNLAATYPTIKDILEKIIDPQDPLYKILAVRMATYEGGPIEKLSSLYTETLYHMLLGGVCTVHQGNREAETYVDLVTIDGGNALLPQKMGDALGSSLHLNMPLKRVSKTENDGFRLTFHDGKEIEAELLVLAIPCSVYAQITFDQGIIPPEKLTAIRKVNYGENAKIMLPFATSPAAATGLIGDKIVCFFDRVQQMLTIFYTGSTSEFSDETIENAYSQAHPMIERGFENCPPFKAPTYARDEANLSYDGAVGYSWPNDPYARGSYSYIAAGQENILTETVNKDGETFKALFAPIDQNLYFVGEHASILFDVPGTMEAACESGERVARTIMQKK